MTPVKFPPPNGKVVDEFQGRAQDDPIYWPLMPSSLIGFNGASGEAFPLLTDEQFDNNQANLGALAKLGISVTKFTTAMHASPVGVD